MSDSVERVAAELRDLIGKYWYVAYQEGVEGRTEDTSEGIAQSILREIEKRIDMLRLARTQAPRGMDRDNTALQLRYGIDYIDGWNDCREAMLAASPAAPEAKVLDVGFSIDYDGGTYTPTVLVGFKPNDWESRDSFALSLDSPATQQSGEERARKLYEPDDYEGAFKAAKPSSKTRELAAPAFDVDCYEHEGVINFDLCLEGGLNQLNIMVRADAIGFAAYINGQRGGHGRYPGGIGEAAVHEVSRALRAVGASLEQPQPDSRGDGNTNQGETK